MITAHQHNVLSLIAAAIFADKHVYDCEVEVFVKLTSKLGFAKSSKPKLSEARLSAWYEMNKDAIIRDLDSPYFKDWFYDLLDLLAELQDKEAVLNVMGEIAAADTEVHVSERALIALARQYWGNTI